MKHIQLEYYGMRGEGRTVTEAKQDAGRRITEAMGADYSPRVIEWRGRVAVIWRTPFGIESAYSPTNEEAAKQCHTLRGTCCHEYGATMEKVEKSIRLSLAQSAADVEVNEMPAILDGFEDLKKEFLSWLGFQRAFRYAKANQFQDCHGYASNHCREHKPNLI